MWDKQALKFNQTRVRNHNQSNKSKSNLASTQPGGAEFGKNLACDYRILISTNFIQNKRLNLAKKYLVGLRKLKIFPSQCVVSNLANLACTLYNLYTVHGPLLNLAGQHSRVTWKCNSGVSTLFGRHTRNVTYKT